MFFSVIIVTIILAFGLLLAFSVSSIAIINHVILLCAMCRLVSISLHRPPKENKTLHLGTDICRNTELFLFFAFYFNKEIVLAANSFYERYSVLTPITVNYFSPKLKSIIGAPFADDCREATTKQNCLIVLVWSGNVRWKNTAICDLPYICLASRHNFTQPKTSSTKYPMDSYKKFL